MTNAGDWTDLNFRIDTETLARRWWAVVLRGVAAIMFGVLAVATNRPIPVLMLLFGAYALVDGILNVVSAVSGHAGARSWALLMEGVVSVAAGLLIFLLPRLSLLMSVYVISAWAIVTGVFEIVAAAHLRTVIRNEWSLRFAGVVSVIFGVLLTAAPTAGAIAMAFSIGAYAILFGSALIQLGLRLGRSASEASAEILGRAA